MENPHSILKKVFGYDSFRPGQEDIVSRLLAGQDVLAVMPTGAGKSICYQVPALLLPGITIVVSPLVSLMKDQVGALVQAGVAAAFLNNSLTDNQKALMLHRAREGWYKIIYVAPERLEMPGFQRFAQERQISMVTVDEAHCISQWGQDFRPSYLRIKEFVDSLPSRPVVGAFTATATARVRDDIRSHLDLSGTPCCYLWLDATYMSCRVGSSVVSQGVVTAIGLGADGRKHFLGCDVVDTESEDSWAAFLGGLRERGLAGVRLVVSDSHAGLVAAVSRLFQGCAWQRCVTHLQRNLQSACSGRPEDSKAAVRDLVHAAVYQDDPDLARCVWAEAAPWVASVSARAGEVFEQAEDSALAFTAFPRAHWAKLRTNNVQERANREIKRRYRVVQSFPSRESMLRLTCASLMETEGQWSQQRVFSEASAAEGFAEPADRPAPTEGRRRALGRRAREIVDEIVEKRGLKKE